MNSALSPREIQSRLRAGASVPEVAAEAGVEVDRIAGFALPVMAERAHMTRTALESAVRRRGDGSGHRRLGDIIQERLQVRSLDADTVEWDSWRQNDLKWRLVGLLDDQAASRAAEFIFDPKGRFSIAANADARWMIGEELPGTQGDPDNENTIDFHDEFALVRATSNDSSLGTTATGRPGDDVPPFESPYEHSAHTSELDELYDMLSGVSEDSVRIYLGLDDSDSDRSTREQETSEGSTPDRGITRDSVDGERATDDTEPEASLSDLLSEHPELPGSSDEATPSAETPAAPPAAENDPADDAPDGIEHPARDSVSGDGQPATTGNPDSSPGAPEQDALLPETAPTAPKRKPARKRASIPSWDEIMFGGPSRS